MRLEPTWLVVEGKSPKWTRSICVGRDGHVLAPAMILGSEAAAMFAATWEGTPIVRRYGRLFISTQTMRSVAEEVPHGADIIAVVEAIEAAAAKAGDLH